MAILKVRVAGKNFYQLQYCNLLLLLKRILNFLINNSKKNIFIGMNFLVATLLYHTHLETIETDYCVIDNEFESDVFWVFVYIMKVKEWRLVYKDDTPKLVELLFELEKRMKEKTPKVHERLFELVSVYDFILNFFSFQRDIAYFIQY